MRVTVRPILLSAVLTLGIGPAATAEAEWGSEAAAADTPLTVGGGWVPFSWEAGSPAGAIEDPFTFNHPTPVYVRVTDAFCRGDQFRVFDSGTAVGDTSPPPRKGCVPEVFKPHAAWIHNAFSHGIFLLSGGPHSITVDAIINPYDGGVAFIRVDPQEAKVVSLAANRLKVREGRRLKLTTLVSPCPGHEGHLVQWMREGKTIETTATDTLCRAVLRMPMQKSATFRTSSPQQDADHLAGQSNAVRVRIIERDGGRRS